MKNLFVIVGASMLITPSSVTTMVPGNRQLKLNFAARAELCTHPLSKKLFSIMAEKKTNLIVSADITTKHELLTLAKQVGPHICMLKTHIDIVIDFDWDLIKELQALADKYNFLIFEDRKFADIGNTVTHQYTQGIHHIADWAHITNAHTLPGPGIIEGLIAGVTQLDTATQSMRGLLLLAQMSSYGNLITEAYTKQTVQMAQEYGQFVIGFICQERLSDDPRFIHMAPGIHLADAQDTLKQQYNTPQTTIGQRGIDAIIVGRGIYQASDPAAAALTYKETAWLAYQTYIENTG